MLPSRSKTLSRLMLLGLVVSVTACAGNCPMPSSDLLMLPPPPSLSTAIPSASYSDSAASDTRQWQNELMGTQLMQKPVARPGL